VAKLFEHATHTATVAGGTTTAEYPDEHEVFETYKSHYAVFETQATQAAAPFK